MNPLPIKNQLEILRKAVSEAEMLRLMRLFYRAMASDTMLGFFFAGRDVDAVADRQAEFLLRAMGLRESYSGKPPAQAHTALPPILPGHFDRRAVILRQVLKTEQVPDAAIAAWVAFEEAFRDAVVKAQS